MGIDMDMARTATGRATAAAGVLETELGAAGRLMAKQGKGAAPARVKRKGAAGQEEELFPRGPSPTSGIVRARRRPAHRPKELRCA
jgi:hypothetical protein